MYGVSPFILAILPLLSQIIFGYKAIKKTIQPEFVYISLINIILQIPLSFLSIYIASENINSNPAYENKCGLIMLGIVAFNFIFAFLLLITIVIQYFIKRYKEKHNKIS
jgi:uncharacterized membrane protein